MATTRRIQTIADQVYSILRKNICEGQYPPGSWLQEVELCNQLGVSRSPVREALHRLVSDGLVVSVPNRGTFVKEFTCRDIDEIFDMRVMLEEYAIRRSRRNNLIRRSHHPNSRRSRLIRSRKPVGGICPRCRTIR